MSQRFQTSKSNVQFLKFKLPFQLKDEANIFLTLENPITLSKFNFDDCMSNIKLSSGGWGVNSNNDIVIQSLSLQVIPRQNCLEIFESKQETRSIKTDDICVSSPDGGYFSEVTISLLFFTISFSKTT